MVIDSDFYMNLALQEGWKYQGLTYPNPAVGCCVVDENGAILALEAHKKAGEAHAEVEALKTAYVKLTQDSQILTQATSHDIHQYLIENHKGVFQNISLYTTLEPCSHVGKTPSCADLISKLQIKKVFIGARECNMQAANGSDTLKNSNVAVEQNVLVDECKNLLFPFECWNKNHFVFFKWAQRLDGSIDNGNVSCKASRKNVHAMRDKVDLLVVGGNTVRIDRPTLDARLVGGKAPDVLILSKNLEFDTTIPLFNVKDRKVFIRSNLDMIKEYNNIMIEGGAAMFCVAEKFIDMSLCYIAPTFGGKKIMNANKDFKIVNAQNIDNDMKIWMI